MPPKNDQNKKENTQDKKKAKKKAKGEGMGGTIGYIDKPVKKCLTAAKKEPICSVVPLCCPPTPPCCSPQCPPIIYCLTQLPCYPRSY